MSGNHFAAAELIGKHTFRQGSVSGDLTITREVDTFPAEWSSTGGRLTGVGFTRPAHIAFARAPGELGGWPGLVEYRWDNDHLVARWTLPSVLHGAIAGGRATLEEGNGAGLAGRFRIQYQDATCADFGPPYDLTITGNGSVRTLEWQTSGTTAFVGIGLVVDDVLVAAWAPPDGSGMEVVDYVLPRNGAPPSMPGRYIRAGEHAVMTELVTL